MSAETRHRFAVLDAWRGLCAIGVMLFHLDAATHFREWAVVRNAYAGVDCFFVLSGFVLASAYGDRLTTLGDGGRFAMRRVGRLYPLHLTVLAAYVVFQIGVLATGGQAFADNYSLPSLAANLALVQGFGSYHETWNFPAWSISVELWVNLAFATYVVALGRWAWIAAGAILGATGAYVVCSGDVLLPVSGETAAALLDVAQSTFGFVLGTLVFGLFKQLAGARWRPGALAEFGALGVAASIYLWRDALPDLASPVAFAFVVLVFAFEGGPISKVLRSRAFLWLGAISYSVYLTHSLYQLGLAEAVGALAGALGQPASVVVHGDDILTLGGPWVMDGAALLCVAATLAGSTLTYRFIEEPARRFFNALSEGRPFAGRSQVLRAAVPPVPIPTTGDLT